MAEFAAIGNMEIWYAHLAEPDIMNAIRSVAAAARTKKEAAQAKKTAHSVLKRALSAPT